MGLAVGIDLGTTNTVVAAVRDGVVSTLTDAEGARLLPSVVSITEDHKVIVGSGAKSRRLTAPQQTILSVKRLIGRPFDAPEVRRASERFGFRLVEGEKQEVCALVRGERYSLPEISAFVLRKARANASAATGEVIDRAVITVPASFNDIQRGATKLAGELAGLEVLRILNEPTAAALSYGCGMTPETIAVYDLGGGTFDFTVLHLASNVFEVVGTAGDTSLGGDDIDQLIVDRIVDELHRAHRIDAYARPQLVPGLQIVAEALKCELSLRNVAEISLDQAFPDADLPSMKIELTRADLDALAGPVIARTIEVCERALAAAGLTPDEIDRTILVGGATRQPLVMARAEALFKKPLLASISPDEVVALGAAVHASALDRSARSKAAASSISVPGSLSPPASSVSSSVRSPPSGDASLPVSSKTELARIRLKRHVVRSFEAIEEGQTPSTAPIAREHIACQKVERPNDAELHSSRYSGPEPDSIPRLAPAPRVDAATPPPTPSTQEPGSSERLADEPPSSPVLGLPPPLLIDVTPLNLGVETAGGFCDPLIEANTPVPCDRTRVFSTAGDDQTSVIIRVAQGGSMMFNENAFLGEVELRGLEPLPRGETKVRVTFSLDENGMLQVRAKDSKTGIVTETELRLIATRQDESEKGMMRARQEFMVLR